MRMMPVKFYYQRARVFVYLLAFCAVVYWASHLLNFF